MDVERKEDVEGKEDVERKEDVVISLFGLLPYSQRSERAWDTRSTVSG